MVLSYVIVYFTTFLGIKSIGKTVYFTSTVPYLLLLILFCHGLTLEGAGEGIDALFYNDPTTNRIADAQVWREAAFQVLFSTGVAYGPVLYFGSARIEHNKLLRASVCLPFIDFLTSIFASIMLFSFMGHISSTKNIEMSDIV